MINIKKVFYWWGKPYIKKKFEWPVTLKIFLKWALALKDGEGEGRWDDPPVLLRFLKLQMKWKLVHLPSVYSLTHLLTHLLTHSLICPHYILVSHLEVSLGSGLVWDEGSSSNQLKVLKKCWNWLRLCWRIWTTFPFFRETLLVYSKHGGLLVNLLGTKGRHT